MIHMKTPISHVTFTDVERLCIAEGLRLGPAAGAYPRRHLLRRFSLLKRAKPRTTIAAFQQANCPPVPAKTNH